MPLLEFTPDAGNINTTTINGVVFSISALQRYAYQLYTNNTISNASKCYLIFDAFKPSMLDNGTWLDATTCYIPYYGISARGTVSIVFGALFGLSVMFTLMNLKKHGAQFLKEDKRFRLVGRRWQWYWMLFVSVCAVVSLFTGVDVDRYYLQQTPIILQTLFFTLMLPGSLAMVWEGTRHWASWEERKAVDADPYGLPQDDRRSRVEFYLPLVFYLFAWIDFFLTIPKSWNPVQEQNTPEDAWDVARPAATDVRNKAGAMLALCAWVVILFSLQHSVRAYKQGKFSACPQKVLLGAGFLGIRIGYSIAAAWSWDVSLFNQKVPVVYPYLLGYAPILAILVVYNVAGWKEENEDKYLIAERIVRGREQDAEIGIVAKPNWWSRNMASRFANDDERLKDMTTLTAEAGGEKAVGENARTSMEMASMNIRRRSASRLGQDPFRDESLSRAGERSAGGEWMGVNSTPVTGTVPQQRVKSMLDV